MRPRRRRDRCGPRGRPAPPLREGTGRCGRIARLKSFQSSCQELAWSGWLLRFAWHTPKVPRERPANTTNPGALLWLGMAASLVFASLSVIAARDGVFQVDRSTDALVGLLRRGVLLGTMETVSLLGQAS